MALPLQPDVPGGDYQERLHVQDPTTGLQAMIVLHSTALGPAAGGIRRLPYGSAEAQLRDGAALASAMTAKCALAELPAGGGKTVLVDHPGLDRAGAYRRLGQVIEQLDGRYLCGPDVGTGEAELAHVRAVTGHVNPEGNDPNEATACGVVAAVRGLLETLDGDPSPQGRTLVVQGLGNVGLRVAQVLLEDGARVVGTDVDATARDRAAKAGIELVAPNEALSTPCDVFVPCALGGVLDERTVETLPAQGVCGSANNQLATAAAGDRLHQRGVRYVPDVVASAGAAIEGVLTTRHGATDEVRARARRHIEATQRRVVELLGRSAETDRAPHRVARAMARERVAAARASEPARPGPPRL